MSQLGTPPAPARSSIEKLRSVGANYVANRSTVGTHASLSRIEYESATKNESIKKGSSKKTTPFSLFLNCKKE